MKTSILSVATLALLAVTFGCERRVDSVAPPAASPVAALPADMFLSAPPAGARDVGALKEDTTASGDVVVHGRIGGRRDPFVRGTAVFLLTDMSLPTCDMGPGDQCPTPWDYCCEPADRIAAHSLTVQIIGPDGQTLKSGLRENSELTPLSELIMKARVARNDGDKSFVVTCTGLYVRP